MFTQPSWASSRGPTRCPARQDPWNRPPVATALGKARSTWLKSPDDRPSTTGGSQDRHVLLGLLTVAILFAVALVGLGVYLDGWRTPESTSPQAESGRGGSEAPAAVESPQPTADAAVNQPPAGGPLIGDRPSPTNQPSEPAGTSGDNAGPAAAPLPDGFQLHTDPTGFTVAVPTGWTRSVEGSRTYFKEPGSGRFLLVDQTTEPMDDPLTDWQANEPSVADRLSGYERISLDRVEYRGWNTADWEFTWDGRNGQIRVLNRNVRVGDACAYALYWSIPESQWATAAECSTSLRKASNRRQADKNPNRALREKSVHRQTSHGLAGCRPGGARPRCDRLP